MREFNANYFKPPFLKKKLEMSPNMCFAAVVFQKVQIALKTGREFLELLVVFSLRTCIFALYLVLKRSKQYIWHFLFVKGQFWIGNRYLLIIIYFQKVKLKKKILQFYSLIGLMKYDSFDIFHIYTFQKNSFWNGKKV